MDFSKKMYMLSMLCGAALGASASHEDDLQLSCGHKDCNSLSLLQARLFVTDQNLRDLKLVGKSFYAKNAMEAAGTLMKYANAELNPMSDISVKPSGEMVVGADMGDSAGGFYNAIFMEGIIEDDYEKKIQEQWENSMKTGKPTVFSNFHDGVHAMPFNVGAAHSDGLTSWIHNERTSKDDAWTRLWVPGTTWSFQIEGSQQATEDDAKQEGFDDYFKAHTWNLSQEEHDKSRNVDPHTQSLWWKTSYAVSNASMARDFALDVLGAKARSSPYEYPPNLEKGWTGAYWISAIARDFGGMEMHFIESGDKEEREQVEEYTAYLGKKAAGLSQGCWHPLLYNTLIFEVGTLDPFVEKLNSWKSPYLAIENGDNDYALIIAFPQNEGTVVQLRSSVLTATNATSIDDVTSSC